MTTAPAIAQDLFCPSCGYNLRGLTGDRCPECGESIEGVRSNVCQIPWVHRKELGWWRAYWRTIYFVMFKQRHFANEMARAVSYRDSQSFRWVTVALAFLPFPLFGFALSATRSKPPMYDPLFLNFSANSWQGVVCLACVLMFLAAATGIPSYLFHPRGLPIEQQNRAIALTYYVCAPLTFAIVPMVLAFLASQISGSPAGSVGIWLERRGVDMVCTLFAGLSGAGILLAWWLGLNHLARRALAQCERRPTLAAVLIPATCLALLAIIVVALPVAVLYVALFVAALVGGLL